MKREQLSSAASDLVFLSLSLLGFAINLLLLVLHFSDPSAGIAGCGGGSCDEVLSSRWALLFTLPVTVFGLLAYAALMVSLTNNARRLRVPLLGMIAGAAGWFVFVQFVFLGKICHWCMTAHGLGILLFLLNLLRPDGAGAMGKQLFWAVASFLAIGLAQVYGPQRATHRIEQSTVMKTGRHADFGGGRWSYDVKALPLLGETGATHVLAEYFDYQCASCLTMSGYLDALVAKHPREVAVLLLPMPLDGGCNEHARAGSDHPGSCGIARTALAVWRVKPEAFPAFHRALIAAPSPDTARRLALELMPAEQLSAALSDPWIDALIHTNIADWRMLSKTTDKLPKLLIREGRIVHGLPTSEEDFIRVMEKELSLQ
jgi:uncharacterized membrane protein